MYREHIENYIAQLNKSENTCEAYRRDLNQMEDFLCANEGATPLDYAEKIREEKPASSVTRIYSSMNGFFRFLGINPLAGLQAPKVVKNPRRVLNEKEKLKLREMPKGYSDKAVRDRAMLAVMFETDYKVSRLIDLKLEDAGKLNLSAHTREILDDYIFGSRDSLLNGNACAHLFTNCDGKPMSRQGFWKIIKRYTADGNI